MMCNGLKSEGDVRTTRHQPSFHLSLNCTSAKHARILLGIIFVAFKEDYFGCLWAVATKNLQAPSFATPSSRHIFHHMTNIPNHYARRFFNWGYLGYALCVPLSTTNLNYCTFPHHLERFSKLGYGSPVRFEWFWIHVFGWFCSFMFLWLVLGCHQETSSFLGGKQSTGEATTPRSKRAKIYLKNSRCWGDFTIFVSSFTEVWWP